MLPSLPPRERQFMSRTKIACSSLVITALLFFGCDSDSPTSTGCASHPVSTNLRSVLYWGDAAGDPCNSVANKGMPWASISLPMWSSDSEILALGWNVAACDVQSGIFQITIDPVTHAFKSATLFDQDTDVAISGYDRNPETGEFLLMLWSNSGRGVARAQLSHGQLVIGPQLISDGWSVQGASYWPGHEGFVFHGIQPVPTQAGYFWMRDDDGNPDSLLVPSLNSFHDSRSFEFSPDGAVLYTADSDYDSTRLHAYELSTAADRVIFSGPGAFRCLDVSPHGDRILLNRRFEGDSSRPPADYVDVIDVATGTATPVDVRTQEASCRFVVALNPAWSPDGNAFAFSAGWASGEGDYAPYSLWVRRLK